jgi:hypothetical protein
MFTRYLSNQAAAQEQGLGFAEPAGEVEPYEAVPVQPVDPALAWRDAVAAAADAKLATPPDWSALVAAQEPALDLTFSLGNFPQLVRHLHPLLAGGDLSGLRANGGRPGGTAALVEWAKSQTEYPQVLLAAGVLRLTRNFDAAAELLKRPAPAAWKDAHANEAAALAWRSGRCEEAAEMWREQPDSTPVLFNRGMAALFLGDAAAAREALTRAVAALPETSAWHHLACLYLALATARG